ncbi:MAG: hypothetical protein HY319_09340 [Armatimonadetes bacterium]|nr:hypothetical protein [Armatimonadota bacterium]
MQTIRQFVDDSTTVITCEWSDRHYAWVCSSENDHRFECCVPRMNDLYPDLQDAGYKELES